MTLSLQQLEQALPNGFHDALVRSCKIDFIRREVEFDLEILVGAPDAEDELARDAYRNAILRVVEFLFCEIEAPDPSYPYAEARAVRIDLCEPDPNHRLLQKLPAGAFAARFFVNEWNAFIHLAARDAQVVWGDLDSSGGPEKTSR